MALMMDDVVSLVFQEEDFEFPEDPEFVTTSPKYFVDRDNFNPHVLLEPVRAIVDPEPVAAADIGEDLVFHDDLVLGMEINGEARAYPINMLTGPDREIVNDMLGGQRIAATW